ncbi:hypothetical protein DXG01_015500, partial [Tephrocybe rancida]
TFSIDGLSRRTEQPGDEKYAPVDPELMDEPKAMLFEYPDQTNNIAGWKDWLPLDLTDFAEEINTRGGYLYGVAETAGDFAKELIEARTEEGQIRDAIMTQLSTGAHTLNPVLVLSLSTPLLPDKAIVEGVVSDEEYPEEHHSSRGHNLDNTIPDIRIWLRDPTKVPQNLRGMTLEHFKRVARGFFLDKKGHLYKRDSEGKHKLVIEKGKRMYMLRSSHDALGH